MWDVISRAYAQMRKETEGLWALVVLPVLLMLAYVAVIANAPAGVAVAALMLTVALALLVAGAVV